VAKINPVKVKQDADKLEKAGKLPEAIALFKQVIEDNPRDWNIINKVGDLYKRAKAGEDFTQMARKENDERMFAAEAPLDIAPSSFAIAKVRDALPKLQPGQVSEPIQDGNAYYLVKLEERTPGVVHAFDEQDVQLKIRTELRLEQYRKLREMDFLRLTKGAAIRADEDMAAIALDMAMQKYAQYAAAK